MQKQTQIKKQRHYTFDILRTIAAYAVIFVHVTAIAYTLYSKDSYQLFAVTMLNRTLKFTTPVFIFLGGVMVNIKHRNKPMNVPVFFTDRFKRILVPYIFFSLLYMLAHFVGLGDTYDLFDVLKKLALGTAKYHLYFIIIITQLYVLTPLAIKLKNTSYKPIILIITFIINMLAVMYLVFPYSDRVFIKYLFPYLTGLLYGADILSWFRHKWVNYLAIVTTLSLGAIYAMTFYFQTIGTKTYSLDFQILIWFFYTNLCIFGLMALVRQLEKNQKFVTFAMKTTGYSFFIYLIHPLVLDVSEKGLNTLGVQSVTLRFGINLMLTLLVSTFLAKWLKKWFSKYGFA